MHSGDRSYQLWVFNSNTTTQELIKYGSKHPTDAVLLLSTHFLFEHERVELQTQIKSDLVFLHFGMYNTDAEMEAIDQYAFESNQSSVSMFSTYINRFKKSMNAGRNAYIDQAIRKEYHISETVVFCTSFDPINLGISFGYWKSQGAVVMDMSEGMQVIKTFFNLPGLEWMVYHFKALLKSILPRKVLQFNFEGQKWSIHSLYRLSIDKDLMLKNRWIIHILASRSSDHFHLIALHDSGKLLNLRPYSSSSHMVVAGDAYRPEIYPPYLFAKPFEGLYYIPRDRTDLNFFKKHGLRTFDQRPSFMSSLDTVPSTPNGGLKTVILSINHAGDWTALINRSDTDQLLQAFVNLAFKIEDLHFVIRPHPTMTGARAEGVHAVQRIEQLVRSSGLKNLELSTLSLEEDWSRGDLFISEYSLSVIDAIKAGKLGLFCNLTGRRSFMDDWERLGMPCVSSEEQLEELVKNAIHSDTLAEQNAIALKRYREAVLL